MAEPLSRLGEQYGGLDPATQAYLQMLARQQASNMSVQPAAGPYDTYNNVSAAPPDPREGGITVRPGNDLPDVGPSLLEKFYQAAAMPEEQAQQQVRNYFGGQAAGIGRLAETPGAVMRENPYASGTELADWYDRQRQSATQEFGPAMGLNVALAGTGGAAAGPGEVMFGAGRKGLRSPGPGTQRGVLTEADFAPVAATPLPRRMQIGGNMPPAEFQYPQYASEYPPPGPPELKLDKAKQKAFIEKGMAPEQAQGEASYLGKLLTPEQKTFQKVRGNIIEDMASKGYTPFFDPSQRYDVDPSHYPPNIDTMAIVPKKQATIDKYMTGTEAKPGLGSEEVRDRLRAAYQRGSEMPNTRNWYMMGQLENEFIKELGPVEGRKQFQEKFAVPMAATTGGMDPTANLLMAQYGNYLRANKLPLPEQSHQYPFPVGGQYAGGNMAMYQKVMEQGGFPGLGEANPKRHNFAQNFTGNPDVATMDEQMVSGMTPGINEPGQQYGLYEKVLREEAARAGVSPREMQEVGWAGFKNLKDPKYTSGKPMIEHVNDAIERTHRLTGMPRDEIMRQALIYGKIPLYGLAATLGAGAATDQLRQRQ